MSTTATSKGDKTEAQQTSSFEEHTSAIGSIPCCHKSKPMKKKANNNTPDPEVLENIIAVMKDLERSQHDPSHASSKSARQAILKNIEKRLVHPGRSPVPKGCYAPGGGVTYPKETKFIFHYQIRRLDDEHTVLDDTRKYGKKMELYSDKEFQLDFWEHCLGSMLPGEVASFTVQPDRLQSFPAVNKKLRDYMLNKKGRAVKHCCGLMSLQDQGGLGYPDLDELMKNPQPLEFIFDLVSVDLPENVRKESWIMTTEERRAVVPVLREEGNQLYSENFVKMAAEKYAEALGLLEQLLLLEKPGDDAWREIDKARVPFFVNLAQCQFKLKDYYAAIESTTEALSRDPTNVKALYRRSKAYTETWDIDLAAKDLRTLAECCPDMAEAAEGDLRRLELKRTEQEMKERQSLRGRLSAGLSFLESD